jgi:glycerophosphoryl diester phosphodiesterase
MLDHRGAPAGAVEIIAHRGYSARAPENTTASIEAAVAAGADAVEFDLHVTRDGIPVLFHDATLDRTTDGYGPLSARSFAEISRLDAGSWFDDAFADERVPTFDEVLSRLCGRIGRVYPEVKGYGDEGDLDLMVDLVLARDMEDRTVFISMDWEALGCMRARHGTLGIGYIVDEPALAPEGIERAAGDPLALLDFKASLLLEEPALARRAQAAGVDLAVWTVDDPDQATDLLALGVRRITTNRVAELLEWRDGL